MDKENDEKLMILNVFIDLSILNHSPRIWGLLDVEK